MKHGLGDIVNSKEYNVVDGVIVGIEQVSSNSGYMDRHYDVESYLDGCNTCQYVVAYMCNGKVYKDTFYEGSFD